MSWPKECVLPSNVRTTSIYLLPKMLPDHALGSYCGWHHSVPPYWVRRAVHREMTLWMRKQATVIERPHGTAAMPTSLMWAAGAASWHGSSWGGSRWPPAAAGWTSAAARGRLLRPSSRWLPPAKLWASIPRRRTSRSRVVGRTMRGLGSRLGTRKPYKQPRRPSTQWSPDSSSTSCQNPTEQWRFPLCEPEPLTDLFQTTGLGKVEVRAIDVPTVFRDFDDYWSPFLGGQAPAPGYAMSLSQERRAALRERIRAGLPTNSEGEHHLIARAWAVRGVR